MKVKELHKLLEGQPDEAEIVINAGDFGYFTPNIIHGFAIKEGSDSYRYTERYDLRFEHAQPVVILTGDAHRTDDW